MLHDCVTYKTVTVVPPQVACYIALMYCRHLAQFSNPAVPRQQGIQYLKPMRALIDSFDTLLNGFDI